MERRLCVKRTRLCGKGHCVEKGLWKGGVSRKGNVERELFPDQTFRREPLLQRSVVSTGAPSTSSGVSMATLSAGPLQGV